MNAKALTRALGGRWFGSYGLAFCPAHDNTRTPALSLRDGDQGRLLAHCFAGCTWDEVYRSLCSRGLADRPSHRPARPALPLDTAKPWDTAKPLDTAKQRKALALWDRAQAIDGSLAQTYLQRRAIQGPFPPDLRFHPNVWHGPSRGSHPAMVALVRGRNGMPVAVHRTYLDRDGRKAGITPNKAMLGPCRGGAVYLRTEAGPLLICEGIETGLSLREMAADRSVWAALSTSGVSGLELPAQVGELIIAPDGDPAGRRAAEALAARAHAQGWAVKLLHPPEGRDWNDVAREGWS